MTLPTKGFSFSVEAEDGAARAGTFTTPRATIQTPMFMPVGTQASVKSLTPDEVAATVRRGEVVVPAPTVMAAGGPEAVRSRVEGGGSDVPPVFLARFDDRTVMVPLSRGVGRRVAIGPTGHWSKG